MIVVSRVVTYRSITISCVMFLSYDTIIIIYYIIYISDDYDNSFLRLVTHHPVGCLVVWLFGCLVVWLICWMDGCG